MFSQLLSRVFRTKENTPPEEMDPHNGSKLKNVYFPDEVLELILSHVEIQTLLKCRQVCKKWNTLITEQVMKTKASRAGFTRGMSSETKMNIPWSTWYMFLNPGSVFGCNLLRNPCGEENKKHWTIIRLGGNGWKVEKTPEGLAADVPPSPPQETPLRNYYDKRNRKTESKASTSCFVTSFGACEKEQIVSLAPVQMMETILDTLKPTIVYREWFCRRFDCGGVYNLTVKLLDKDMKVIEEKSHRRSIDGDFNWLRVENKFENYPEGVRFVTFRHLGVDNQFWMGHYGPKMTGAALFLIPPGVTHEIPVDNNVPTMSDSEQQNVVHDVGWDGIPIELIPPYIPPEEPNDDDNHID